MPAFPIAATRMSAERQKAGQIPRFAVANGDGGVFVQQQHRHGLAHDIAATHDHGMLARNGNSAALQHLNNAGGSAGRQRGLSTLQAANIHRMKSIDIFLRRNGLVQQLLDPPGAAVAFGSGFHPHPRGHLTVRSEPAFLP